MLNIFQDSDNNCRARFDFDFTNQDLLDGLEQLKNLRKLVFVVRSQPDEQMEDFKYKQLLNNECPKESSELGRSVFLSTISGMKELEEFYLYDSAFNNIEELYIDYNHWAMSGGVGKSLDLSSFYNLSKISYRFFVDGGLGEYSWEERSKLILNNMNNLGNDLQIKVMFEPHLDIELENLKNFDICLDSDITQEFLSENVEIIWEGGIEDYTLINLKCD